MHSFLVRIPRFSNPRSGRSDRGSRKVSLLRPLGYRKCPLDIYFTSSKSASVTVSSLPLFCPALGLPC